MIIILGFLIIVSLAISILGTCAGNDSMFFAGAFGILSAFWFTLIDFHIVFQTILGMMMITFLWLLYDLIKTNLQRKRKGKKLV